MILYSLYKPIMKILAILMQCFCIYTAGKNMKILIQIIRHGSRNYIHEINNLKLEKSTATFLTRTGIRSSFLLGSAIRKTYSDFFDQLPIPQAVEAKASSSERTMMTGASFLYGLFSDHKLNKLDTTEAYTLKPPVKDFNIDHAERDSTTLPNNFYPIPVMTYYRNNLFLDGLHRCPRSGQQVDDFIDAYSKDVIYELQPTIDYLDSLGYSAQAAYGVEELTFRQLSNLCDTLFSLIWTQSKSSPNDIMLIAHCRYVLALSQFVIFQNDTIARDVHLARYILFQDIIDRYNDNQLPLYVPVFAHDDTVTSMLSLSRDNFYCILDAYRHEFVDSTIATDPQCITSIPYNANITLEIFTKEDPLKLYIQGLYNGEPYDLCDIESECTLKYFMDMFKAKIAKTNYNDACGAEVFEKYSNYMLFKQCLAFILTSVLFLVLLVYLHSLRPSPNKRKFRTIERSRV